MDVRKLVSPEQLISSICCKGRVISGFGVGLLAALLVFFLLFSVGGNGGGAVGSVPSLLNRFFSVPGNGSAVGSPELPGSWLAGRGESGTEETSAGKSSVSGEQRDVEGRSPGGGSRGKEVGWGSVSGITHGGNLSGEGGDVLGEGVKGRSHGNGSGASAYLEWGRAGKRSENGTLGSNVLKQGGKWKGSPDGNLAGLGNGSVSVESEATAKSDEKNSSAKLMDASSTGVRELPPGINYSANSSMQDSNSSLSGAVTVEEQTNKTVVLDGGRNGTADSGEAKESHEAAVTDESSSSRSMNSGLPVNCDIFNGRWVRDENKPYYPPGSCPLIDLDFNCHDNGRPDYEFLRWRWQPNDCDIPSMNATDFLKRLRGQRLIFVGDSLNRNMWESLVCILRHGVRDKNRVYEMSGQKQFKTSGYYSFMFEDYNCSIDFVRSPFLVRELYTSSVNGLEDEKLRLDAMDATTSAYRKADIVVFNTGHWWTHEKTSRGINYYQEGQHVYPVLKVMEAYKKALSTWAKWVDKNINPSKTQVVFRGYSLTHFSGGQWNSGGQCHTETEPIFNQSFVRKYPKKMGALEQVLKQMKTPVIYLNISLLTDYRKDGHPSIYRKNYQSAEEQINAVKFQDCSHWCLPGIPDTWNELLYASLLMVGRGSWRS